MESSALSKAKVFCFRTDTGPTRLLNPLVYMEGPLYCHLYVRILGSNGDTSRFQEDLLD
jgi:hypothetical protein